MFKPNTIIQSTDKKTELQRNWYFFYIIKKKLDVPARWQNEIYASRARSQSNVSINSVKILVRFDFCAISSTFVTWDVAVNCSSGSSTQRCWHLSLLLPSNKQLSKKKT